MVQNIGPNGKQIVSAFVDSEGNQMGINKLDGVHNLLVSYGMIGNQKSNSWKK